MMAQPVGPQAAPGSDMREGWEEAAQYGGPAFDLDGQVGSSVFGSPLCLRAVRSQDWKHTCSGGAESRTWRKEISVQGGRSFVSADSCFGLRLALLNLRLVACRVCLLPNPRAGAN